MQLALLIASLLGDLLVAGLIILLYKRLIRKREDAEAPAPVSEHDMATAREHSIRPPEAPSYGTEKHELLRALLSGRLSGIEQMQAALSASMLFGGKDGSCEAIVFRYENSASVTLDRERNDIFGRSGALAKCACELLGGFIRCEAIIGDDGEVIAIICGAVEQRENQERVINLCRRVIEEIKASHQMSYNCGIGVCVESLIDLPHSLTSARLACEYRLFYGQESVIRYTDIEYRNSVPYHYPDEVESNIIKYMKQANGLLAEKEVLAFFKAIENANVRSVALCIHNLVVVICHYIKMTGEIKSDELDYYSVIDRIERMDTIHDMMREINALVQLYINYASQKRFEKNDGTIDEIVQFMEQNYQNPTFSIYSLEEHMHYSGNHIRNLFKEAYQCTPIEYLLQLRIGKAKQLLAATDVKAVDIAKSVGYDNAKYFYSLFKKCTGMTTYEYRTSVQGKKADSNAAEEEVREQ